VLKHKRETIPPSERKQNPRDIRMEVLGPFLASPVFQKINSVEAGDLELLL
jgi:hypothetical protein